MNTPAAISCCSDSNVAKSFWLKWTMGYKPWRTLFALDMSKGKVITNYKETGGQGLVLIGLRHYDGLEHNQFAQEGQQLVEVLTKHFYETTYHGYFYRVTADFQIYVTHPGQGNGVEDYSTTEAMGVALDALQMTE